MVEVLSEIIIARPPGIVFNFASDPDNAPKWYVNINSSERLTPGPLAVGSRIAFTAQFLGRKLEYIYEIREYIPERKLVMKTADGPFPMETTYTWEPVDGSNTRMTLMNRGNPAGFSKLISPFISLMMKKANTKDLQRLKKIIENQ